MADITVGVAGERGAFTAFALGADIPAFLRKGDAGAPGGRWDFLRGSLNLHRQGVQIPLRVNRAGHYSLRVADFRNDPSRIASRRPDAPASFCLIVHKFPNMSDGGTHFPYTPDGPFRIETPLAFAACEAVTLGAARDGSLTGPKKIIMKLHVDGGHASPQQWKRALVDSEGNNMHLPTYFGEVLAQREVCPVFEKAPRSPVAGAATVA